MKKIGNVIKDILLVISLFLVSIAILSGNDYIVSDNSQFFIAIPLTFIIIYVWKKIDNKFFK